MPIVCKEMCACMCFLNVFLYVLCVPMFVLWEMSHLSRAVQLFLNPHQGVLIFDTKDVMADVV